MTVPVPESPRATAIETVEGLIRARNREDRPYISQLARATEIVDAVLPAVVAQVQAEQRETDAQIAEEDNGYTASIIWDDRRKIAAAIRAVPANTNTEEDN